jgi:outer membrane lipoprotein-sorting protein
MYSFRHRPTRQMICLTAGLCLLGSTVYFVCTGPAAAKPQSANKQLISSSTPMQRDLSVDRTTDGRDFLKAMNDAANALTNYTFDYETDVYKGGKTIQQEGKFYFKEPRQIRVQMTGAYKRGAEAVLMKDGRVRGHLGGALAPFVITLQPNSDMLLGANGYPLVDSDFLSMAQVMTNFVSKGVSCRVTETPVVVDSQPRKMYVIEFQKNANELFKRAYVDPQNMLPTEWFDYDSGKLFARTTWRNFKNNAGLKDDFFKL